MDKLKQTIEKVDLSQLTEIKVYQDRSRNSRFKKYKAHRDGELPRNIGNSEAANELIDFALDKKGF